MMIAVFNSDGERVPKGQYLVTIDDEDPDAMPELAWRPDADTRIVWNGAILGSWA